MRIPKPVADRSHGTGPDFDLSTIVEMRSRNPGNEEPEGRALSERAQRALQQAVEAMSLGVTVTDVNGIITYVNPADAEMHGYPAAELLGKSARVYGLGDLPDLESQPPTLRYWDRESINIRKDNTRFPVRLISNQVTDPKGNPVGLLTICEDLTQLKAAEGVREDFLSAVSHELRTPLTSIVAALALIDDDSLRPDPERAAELIQIAYRNSSRLLRLVDDLLDLQRLKAGKLGFHLETVEVLPALESAIEDIRAYADSRKVRIELGNLPPDARIFADRHRFLQVITNLLSNAIKYSPTGEQAFVQVTAATEGEKLEIAISDNGPGIPTEDLATIFEPFYRVGSSPSSKESGTGLGLSIVKRLLDGMAGSVSVTRRHEGGTIFRVGLPAPGVDDSPV